MHDENALTTPKCTLSNAMPTTSSHIYKNANSPMLRQGIFANANRGHNGEGRGKKKKAQKEEWEEEKKVGGAGKGVSHAMSGGKH